MSQLALANEAEISARHLCFLETGRSRPSRDMVLLLAGVLDVPLRERNQLLLAAGFAPLYAETALDSPELGPVRAALDAILTQQEPFPAVVMNRRWDIVRSNEAARRFFALMLADAPAGSGSVEPSDPRPPNVLRLMFDQRALRPRVSNWSSVAEQLIARVHRESVAGVKDAATLELLEEVLAYPGVPRGLRRPNLEAPQLPIVAIHFESAGQRFHFFSTVTTLGTPQDITLQELRIECFFPADRETAERARKLGGGSAQAPS